MLNINELKEDREAFFESIIENSDDAIISRTPDGVIISWNKGAERIFGYTPGEAIGKDITLIIPDERKHEYLTIVEKIMEGLPVRHYVTKRRCKDGRLADVSLTVSPIRSKAGMTIGISLIARDITNEKRAEESLRKSEQMYRTIARNLPGAIVTIVDRDNRYTFAEGEGLKNVGYTREGLEHSTDRDALDDYGYQLVENHRKKAFNGEKVTINAPIRGYYFRISFIPLYDDHHNIYAVMTLSLDITDVKRASDEIEAINESLEKKVKERTQMLENANQELEAFSYSVSHDLRAPLRIINGYADILSTDHSGALDDEGQRILDVIMGNTRKMGTLIDELLNLAQYSRKELNVFQTDMNEIVNSIIETELAGTDVRYIIKKSQLLPAICDGNLIRQVWINLLSNAFKYSGNRPDPCVEIASFLANDKVIYSVRDNGVGFDMQYAGKLFGVFQRLHKRSEFDGTGVGLALVQRIIKKHGGEVWADAREGQGATFYFSLQAK